MEISQLHEHFLKSNGLSTDTRKIEKDTLFFALKGENFNANEFAQQALDKGASFAIVDEKRYATTNKHILVEDSLKALQQLAHYHRNFLGLPILALTGSNGKTTTKELINSVLSTRYKTSATKGNLNNHIGVPLTLLSMTKQTEIGIVEMGANHHGEIALLCQIAEPDFGYITNFGKAHLEGFGSLEGVKKAKSELYDFLKAKNGLLFLNADDETQQKHLSYSKVFSFGNQNKADLTYEILDPTPSVQLQYEKRHIESKLIGNYNAPNIAAAVAIGTFFKIEKDKIAEAVEAYEPSNNRSQVLSIYTNKIILDAYNANPTSMEAALRSFNEMKADKKHIVCGDMFEMGASAAEEHQNIINLLEELEFDKAYVVGENFYKTKTNNPKIERYKNIEDLKSFFNIEKLQGCTILIKGSRGMALERILK